MRICKRCFRDSQLISMLDNYICREDRKDKLEICPTCGSKSICTFEVEAVAEQLSPYFNDLLDLYALSKEDTGITLLKELREVWGIFNPEVSNEDILDVIGILCRDAIEYEPDFLNGNLEISSRDRNKNLIIEDGDWDSFTTELKEINRYHSKRFNKEVFSSFLPALEEEIALNHDFYRARISKENGFKIDEMYAPPSEKSSDGRANAKGIFCLYLAGDKETTLKEVRANAWDYVTIASFKSNRTLKLINLDKIKTVSPFQIGSKERLRLNIDTLSIIDSEMKKGIRSSDGPLDYIPSQYIIDYIKSIYDDGKRRYDGVIYKSTLSENGTNYAMFESDCFDGVKVEVHHITALNYSHNRTH